MGSKIDVNKTFDECIILLNEHSEICFESILRDCVGVGKDWFYDVLMKDKDRSEAIKKLIKRNRGGNVLKAIKNMNASEAPACILGRIKILNKEMRKALTEKEESQDDSKPINITIN